MLYYFACFILLKRFFLVTREKQSGRLVATIKKNRQVVCETFKWFEDVVFNGAGL